MEGIKGYSSMKEDPNRTILLITKTDSNQSLINTNKDHITTDNILDLSLKLIDNIIK